MKLHPALGLLAGVLLASSAEAQTPTAAVVARYALVLDEPQREGRVLGAVDVGTPLDVHGIVEDYYLVTPPAGSTLDWQRGYVLAVAFVPVETRSATARPSRSGRMMVRGFGHAGGLLFTAHDSFETILGGTFNSVFGIGGQVVFPNGIYAQASFDRFQDTGTRALVSGTQVFTLEIANRITVTPILMTGGYRRVQSDRMASYFGGGIGWYSLDEDSPSIPGAETISSRHTGYHVVGGAEFAVARWMAIAGELQWATVPNALGETGVSAVYGEKDLGGTTFRVKVLFGY